AVAGEVESVLFPAQTHGAVGWLVGEIDGPVRLAVAVVIHEDAAISPAGHDDAALRIDGQAIDIVGELAIGEFDDLEAGRNAQAVLDRLTEGDERAREHDCERENSLFHHEYI